jgi:hypothetical protein
MTMDRMATNMKPLCDKHPHQMMVLAQLTSRDPERSVRFLAYVCPEDVCNRAYDLWEGYFDVVEGKPAPDSTIQQQRCPEHASPLYLARFQVKPGGSVRTWRCAQVGCRKESTTTGEIKVA